MPGYPILVGSQGSYCNLYCFLEGKRTYKEKNTMAKDLKKGTMPLVSEQVNPSEHAFTWLGLLSLLLKKGPDDEASRSFLLKVIQPGLSGLMDGSVSTLAPIFATAFASHQPFMAFLVGLASATGAGISMAFSEALS